MGEKPIRKNIYIRPKKDKDLADLVLQIAENKGDQSHEFRELIRDGIKYRKQKGTWDEPSPKPVYDQPRATQEPVNVSKEEDQTPESQDTEPQRTEKSNAIISKLTQM